MKTLKTLGIFFLAFAATYAVTSFITQLPDARDWGELTRLVYVVVSLYVGSIAVGMSE